MEWFNRVNQFFLISEYSRNSKGLSSFLPLGRGGQPVVAMDLQVD
jgi:hypothetical protein